MARERSQLTAAVPGWGGECQSFSRHWAVLTSRPQDTCRDTFSVSQLGLLSTEYRATAMEEKINLGERGTVDSIQQHQGRSRFAR